MIEAPSSAQLVEAFANTVDVELGTDDLAGPGRFAAWLADRGLMEAGSPLSAADRELGLRLRAAIREELGVHGGDTPDPDLLLAAEEALRALPLLGTVRRGTSAALLPAPELPPGRRALALIAVAWTELVITGEAARLKRCAEHACAWVFWDVSKNRSRRWCSMRVCGNRTKARRYAARQAAAAG